MIKFSFWDSSYKTSSPRRFEKDSRKQIESNTLDYMKRFGRAKWIPVVEIFKETLEQSDLFNSNDGRFWFAKQGIKSKISSATHKLRRDGHPIISGKGHKGYRYADEDCEDFIDRWNEVFSSQKDREENLKKEYETYKQLLEKIIERLLQKGREKEAEKLKQVLVQYQR